MMRILLVCLLVMLIIQSCDEEPKSVWLIHVPGSDGKNLYLGNRLELMFRGQPQSVFVNGVPMKKSRGLWIEGCTVFFNEMELFVKEPGPLTLEVVWTDSTGKKKYSKTLHYEVIPYPTYTLEFVRSEPADGDTNVDSNRINTEGIRLVFTDSINIVRLTLHVTADGQELQWATLRDAVDEHAILLRPLFGNGLGFGQEVVVRLENIYIHTRAIRCEPDGTLELHFTTAEN